MGEFLHPVTDVFRGDQRLSYQDGMSANFTHAADILGVANTTLRDQGGFFWNETCQPGSCVEINLECLEVPVVDADQE
jgi:hypothetical protein